MEITELVVPFTPVADTSLVTSASVLCCCEISSLLGPVQMSCFFRADFFQELSSTKPWQLNQTFEFRQALLCHMSLAQE